jgi:hypothetical protein
MRAHWKALTTFLSIFISLLSASETVLAQEKNASETGSSTETQPPAPAEKAPEVKEVPKAKETPKAKEAPKAGETPKTTPPVVKTEEPKPDFHAATPEYLLNKLSLGMGLGLGFGSTSGTNTSLDYAGYEFNAGYLLEPFAALAGARWVAELKYKTLTGISSRSDYEKDESYAVQLWMAGGGLEYKIDGFEKWRFLGTGHLGLSKLGGIKQATGMAVKSKYGGNVGLTGRAAYSVLEKVEVYTGVGIVVGSHSWFDVQLGVLGTF